jgi:hypothetical protein
MLRIKVVHVIVVLCDNRNQGIVPVPAVLGNGQDPMRNLYWGARYGVRTFLGKSSFWQEVHSWTPPAGQSVLAGAVFVSRSGPEVVEEAELRASRDHNRSTPQRQFYHFSDFGTS